LIFRLIVAAFWISVGISFSLKVVFLPALLEITATADRGDYAEGTLTGGIAWKHNYTDTRIQFTNPTDHDYHDLDVGVVTDKAISKVGQIAELPSCSFAREGHVATVTGHRKDGTERQLEETATTGIPYRLRCAKIPNHSALQIVLATTQADPMNLPTNEHTFGAIPDAPKVATPKWIVVRGEYRVLGRTHAFVDTLNRKLP
jgi:hypothetical protein